MFGEWHVAFLMLFDMSNKLGVIAQCVILINSTSKVIK